jgi:hypothetical protein
MPFVTSGESPIVSLIDQMNAALKEAGIERSSFEKYTVYSLRAENAKCAQQWSGCVRSGSQHGHQEYYGKQATPTVFATRLGD